MKLFFQGEQSKMQPKYLRSSVNHEMIAEWVNEGLIDRTTSTELLVKYYPLLDLDDLNPLSSLLSEHDYEGLNKLIPEICARNKFRFNEESLKAASKKDFPKDFYQSQAKALAYRSLNKCKNVGFKAAQITGYLCMSSTSKAIRYVRYQTAEFLAISSIIGALATVSFVVTMPFRTPYDGIIRLDVSDKDTIGGLIMNFNDSDTQLIVSPNEKFTSIDLEVSFEDTPDKARLTVLKSEFSPQNTSLMFSVGDRFKELKYDKPSRLTLIRINR